MKIENDVSINVVSKVYNYFNFFKKNNETELDFPDKKINETPFGDEYILNWWKEDRILTIYINEVIEYLKSWKEEDDTRMEMNKISDYKQLDDLWKWLENKNN